MLGTQHEHPPNFSCPDYDADYETGRIQTFISQFKNKKLRELEK